MRKVMVKEGRMLSPARVLALALAILCVSSTGARGQCWEHKRCKDLSSEENILECIELCRSDLTAESPVYPGDGHLQPPPESEHNDISAALMSLSPVEGMEETNQGGSRREDKRSYSMEHFRWGKPVGRKRRPVKVYTNGVEEESAEVMPPEMRRELPGDMDYALEENAISPKKKDTSYKMNHFRWSGPPTSKRYGGFMKSWDERSKKPLLTLFRNVIIKDGQQKKDQ
ncbi:proopiomelanocortin a isoform X1 [Denticeps clupeoides]|uniref:Corticotropin n=1 Tax=Denticeps clupeoides TaxID=299321 RepID=A0AAY4B1M7_9TELE|nr:pro-opiomelanocortin isoform X1 [Denticeps clupeoides]